MNAKQDIAIGIDTQFNNEQSDYEIDWLLVGPLSIFSLLLCFPDKREYAQYAKSFYAHEHRSFYYPDRPHDNFSDLNYIGAAEYIPNRAIVFARTNKLLLVAPQIIEPGIIVNANHEPTHDLSLIRKP